MKFLYLDEIKIIDGFYKGEYGKLVDEKRDQTYINEEIITINVKYLVNFRDSEKCIWISENILEKQKPGMSGYCYNR